MEHKGIVMEIVKELSRMLNFSYVLHDAHAFSNDEPVNDTVGILN